MLTREQRMLQEEGKSVVRTLHLSELQEAGEARLSALDRAAVQREVICALLPGALEAGLSLSQISRVTGVSRQTLYVWKALRLRDPLRHWPETERAEYEEDAMLQQRVDGC